jgi:hypothetical protein
MMQRTDNDILPVEGNHDGLELTRHALGQENLAHRFHAAQDGENQPPSARPLTMAAGRLR